MQYTSKILIENYLKRELTADEEAFLFVGVPGIERYIDAKLGSHFGSVDATTRRYDGGATTVDIDPCTDITLVELLDSSGDVQYTYINEDEYIAAPVNETVKNELRRKSGRFPEGEYNVRVTAKFSEYDDGVPEDIKMVATRLAASIIAGSAVDADGNALSSESIEGHNIVYDTSNASLDNVLNGDPIVRAILDQRKQIMV